MTGESTCPLRVLWWSRHPPTPEQTRVLEERLAPDRGVECLQVDRSAQSAAEVVDAFQVSGAEEMVVVLPLHLLAGLVAELERRGLAVRPLRAVMERTVGADGEVSFAFRHFERILQVDVQTERL
ncbi:MAG: hypothetical protein IRZ33_06590 [Alicyclobacillaceae bacterium]|nr:hypothetical protein [Alicyclobacillaceae bacterium]